MTALLVADLFCGAGGSSSGAKRALARRGLRMDLVAVNHWNIAVETHQRNHPEARHVCVDLFRTRPRDVVPGGRLDLLMASPTCTFHSRARGGKPISRDQKYGRMTPTQVLRWVRDLDVRCLLVENVPEFVEWGPVHQYAASHPRCLAAGCRAERPCRRRAGCYFRAWTRRLEGDGYRVEHRVLNAADFGGATTRSRFFLLGRKDGRPITWPPPTHAKRGPRVAQGDLFGGVPLKPWRGAREVIDWSLSGRSIFGRKKPLSPKTLARIQAGAVKFGWPEPFLALLRHHIENPRAPLPTFDPVPTATTSTGGGVALVEPLVVRTDMHRSNAACVRGAGDPLATVTTGGGLAVAAPSIVFQVNQGGDRARNLRPDTEPLQTIVTRPSLGVAEPILLPQGTGTPARSIDAPAPAVVAVARQALVEPVILPQGGGGAARPVADPVATVATDGAHALVTPYYGTGAPSPVTRPLPTVTTRDRFGLVMPVTHDDASARARSLEDPLPTVTASFGERHGQAPRVHDVAAPVPTICAEGRVDLVQGRAGPTYDILFRMLTPRELARAMGFSDAEQEYEFAGNKTEITRQIGNAVSVEQAEALVGAIVDADAGVAARERVA